MSLFSSDKLSINYEEFDVEEPNNQPKHLEGSTTSRSVSNLDINNGDNMRSDVQELMGLADDDVELDDYETPEEYLLHFARIGRASFVQKLIDLKIAKQISLNINCKGTHSVLSLT